MVEAAEAAVGLVAGEADLVVEAGEAEKEGCLRRVSCCQLLTEIQMEQHFYLYHRKYFNEYGC